MPDVFTNVLSEFLIVPLAKVFRKFVSMRLRKRRPSKALCSACNQVRGIIISALELPMNRGVRWAIIAKEPRHDRLGRIHPGRKADPHERRYEFPLIGRESVVFRAVFMDSFVA